MLLPSCTSVLVSTSCPGESSRPQAPARARGSRPWPAATPAVLMAGGRGLIVSVCDGQMGRHMKRWGLVGPWFWPQPPSSDHPYSPTMYRSMRWKPLRWLIASLASSGLSYTTYAVPLVLSSDDVPTRTCRIGPYLPKRSYRSAPVMLKLLRLAGAASVVAHRFLMLALANVEHGRATHNSVRAVRGSRGA